MVFQGKIIRWDDKRGFGFIQETQSTMEIFVHISSFISQTPRPTEGEAVSFDITNGKHGRKEANNVRYLARMPATGSPSYIGHDQKAYRPPSAKPLFRLPLILAFSASAIAGYAVWFLLQDEPRVQTGTAPPKNLPHTPAEPARIISPAEYQKQQGAKTAASDTAPAHRVNAQF